MSDIRDNENAPPDAKKLLSFVEGLKRQWMATIDALIDPLMIVDRGHRILKANRAMARMAGLGVKELLGKRCYEVFSACSTPCKGCRMMESGADGEARNFSLEEIRGGRYYEVTSQPIMATDGKLEGIVQIYRDRTEAKRMQEQLLQSEKLASIGLLAGGIAHEINNPLGGIMVFSQMLLKEISKDDPHWEDVREIEAAAQRCKTIVESLLDFARSKPGRGKVVPEVVDMAEAARTALRLAKVSPMAKLVEVFEEFEEGLVIIGDRNKIVQVYLNLIQNAMQAIPDGGEVTLRSRLVTEDDGRIGVFEVEDSGIGIPAEQLKQVFDPFFTTKEPGEGTGLGLAICYGIVQDFGGRLEVQSTVNVGSCFRMTFPLANEQATKRAS